MHIWLTHGRGGLKLLKKSSIWYINILEVCELFEPVASRHSLPLSLSNFKKTVIRGRFRLNGTVIFVTCGIIPFKMQKNKDFWGTLVILLKKGATLEKRIEHWVLESPPDSFSWPRCKNKSARRPKSLWWPPWRWINMRQQEHHMLALFFFNVNCLG